MTSPLRILLVVGTSTGGIGQHVRSLSDRLVARGHRVVVAGPAATEDLFAFTQGGARFVEGDIGVRPSPSDVRAVRVLARWVRGADVVHAHGFRAALVAISAGAGTGRGVGGPRRMPVPLVVTWHNQVLAEGVKGRVMHRAEAIVARRATLSLGASQDLVDRARDAGGRARLGPVAAPVPGPAVRSADQVREELEVGPAPLLLSVGRLHQQKDFPTLIDAVELLSNRSPRPVLVIAGDGPEREAITRLVADRGVPVRLLGHRDDVSDLLRAADVFVLSSVWEARALVVQEAMGLGVPVVATAVGGLPELVGDDALLIAPHDAVALSAAIGEVLDHPEQAAVRAARAQNRAAGWPDEDDVVDQVLDVYRSLTGTGRGAGTASE